MTFAHYTHEQAGDLLNWLLDHEMPFDNPEGLLNPTYSELPIYHEFEGNGAAINTLR